MKCQQDGILSVINPCSDLRVRALYPRGEKMRKYETVFILDPDMNDQARGDMLDKVKGIIDREGGIYLDLEQWGNRKLAYEIKKKVRGVYFCQTFGGTGALVKELERNLRLSDQVLKFMTLMLSDEVTVEQLKEEASANEQAALKEAEETAKKAEAEAKAEETAEESSPEEEAATEETETAEPAETEAPAETETKES